MAKNIRDVLDIAKIKSGYGNVSAAALNVLKGINHRGAGNIVPANTDNQGYTFFTKPNLNMNYDNLLMARRLTFLMNSDDISLASAIRCMLSPEVIDNWGMSVTPKDSKLGRSRIIDDRYAFLPLLSNTLINISGWPDFVLEAFTSNTGLRKETVSWVDSIADNYTAFDLTANFQNMDGDPVTVLFAAWCEYAARVAEGSMNPHANMIIENEIDYQTRIYRVVLDPTRTQVRKIAETGIAFPSAVPIGAAFNYGQDNIYTQGADQISIRFSCTGVRYNDPITVYNFNRTVETFNPSMRDSRRLSEMHLLTPQERPIFNYMGFPRISEGNIFEWWVSVDEYNRFKNSLDDDDELITGLGSDDSLGIHENVDLPADGTTIT